MIPDDDDFAERLAALDAELAAGHTPAEIAADTPGLGRRLRRGLHALHALHDLRPQTIASAPEHNRTHIGRFEVTRELGRGGFGVVLLARDPDLGREVALKLPHAGALVDETLRERFRREARAAAGLDHPNIVSVYEVGEIGPVCYIAAAYCPGETLAARLARREPMPVRDAAVLVADLADAVAYAHTQGVIHRDLKPSNILLAGGGREARGPDGSVPGASRPPLAKITDFGLAKLVGAGEGLTRSGAALGTPSYMAPEQANGRLTTVGPAADVYALGAILYECLTGRPPFRGESDVETLQQVATLEPVSPRRLRPVVPRDVETVCLKCLEKNTVRRYVSAAALADDLRRVVDGRPVLARPVGRLGRLWRWARRKPVVAGLAASLITTAVVGAAAFWQEYRRAERERNAAVAEKDRTARLLEDANESLLQMTALGERYAHEAGNVDESREVLETACRYCRRLRDGGSLDDRLRIRAAEVCHKLAVLDGEVGRHDTYANLLDESADLYEAYLTAHPDDRRNRLTLVVMLYSGRAQWDMIGASRRAATCRERCAPHAAYLFNADPHDPDTIVWHAGISFHRAEAARQDEDWPAAEAGYRADLDVMANLPADKVEPRHDSNRLVNQGRLAEVLVRTGQVAEAEPLAAEAERAARVLPRFDLFSPSPNFYLGEALVSRGLVEEARGRLAEALKCYEEATPLLEQSVQDHTKNVVRRAYAPHFRNANARADLLERLQRPADALAVLKAAFLPQPQPSPRPFPDVPQLPQELDCRRRLVTALARAGRLDDARREHAAAIKAIIPMPEPTKAFERAVAELKAAKP
jgi:tetratricopeptide (TPR) repeat protein